jgi:hypothetical protein
MNTVPPNDFTYFEVLNDLVQKEPVGALDPEIMGSLAAVGIVKGQALQSRCAYEKDPDRRGRHRNRRSTERELEFPPVRRVLLLLQLCLV